MVMEENKAVKCNKGGGEGATTLSVVTLFITTLSVKVKTQHSTSMILAKWHSTFE